MKVLVLGSGVIGVTTAWYLAQAGHEVVVIDRQDGAGKETSFANAGQLSYGYSSPWAGPGVPMKAVKWLLMHHRPFVLWPRPDWEMLSWLARMAANCTERAYRRNKGRMVRVAEYSRVALAALRAETGIEFDHRARGTVQLFRTQKQLDHVGGDTAVLDEYGVPWELLDPAACIAAEPALARVKDRFVGGLRLPQDETGDAFLFTQRLAERAREKGVAFHLGVGIAGIRAEGGRVVAVETDHGDFTADAYVAALGSHTPAMLRPLGLHLPVYPIKGYSLTLPVTEEAAAPVSTVMDETYKIAITRLGDRIRVGGTAEIAGFSTSLRKPRRETLEHSVRDLFPDGGDIGAARFWTGLRPMTPDGTPIIGQTPLANLFTNTGHGTLGWTMACGSGRVLADIVSGRSPDIDVTDLGLSRYG
ncbi:D-amino acid dehydrogenase [Roseomonas sp. SSH11]|uniref:D-amino acid dehydrogenase n=2 Tax=Pararoseomonas baculiformis TaxID=2820812 RepID=A0ABS4ADZ5_9PROT|nr:D-amino acid dehydrogenase [Pararoseomonas baculiformis]MBP0445232.1 D-amino acid dehydrogenase [Pararoseomonas baculiformis]